MKYLFVFNSNEIKENILVVSKIVYGFWMRQKFIFCRLVLQNDL